MPTNEKNKDFLFKDFKNLHITKKARQDVLNHPEKYSGCDVRIRMGNFYTDEEYEKHIEESLNRPLPDKKVKVFTKRRK